MITPRTPLTLLLAAWLVGLPPLLAVAHADATSALRCQVTINKELAKFIKTKSSILKVCKEGAVKRGVPASPVNCPDTRQDDRINAAAQRLRDRIAAKCGGTNKLCNSSDVGADADEPLADIGWDIGACPDLRGQGCTNAINDCNDVGTCVTCIGHEAVNQANELYYDLLAPAEFATGSDVNKCQVAIGNAATKFLQAKSNLLQSCWGKVLAGKAGFSVPPGCPDTDPGALATLAKAERKKVATICKACGAGGDADGDGACDLPGQGFPPVSIGFEPDCPNMTVPGSPTSCGAVIDSLGALIQCVDCVTNFEMACATDLVVPTMVPYPPECSAIP